MRERWKVVSGFPNYAVSTHGRIKRLVSRTSGKTGHVLKPCLSGPSQSQYISVGLYRNGQQVPLKVHKIVAFAFHGLRPTGMTINHRDGNRRNNRSENLEYMTASANQIHRLLLGPRKNVKLTPAQVRLIQHTPKYRGFGRDLALRFGVSRFTIYEIRTLHRTWNCLTPT